MRKKEVSYSKKTIVRLIWSGMFCRKTEYEGESRASSV